MQIEVEVVELYRKLAKEVPEPLNEVFERLAQEEWHHHNVLEKAFEVGNVPVLHESDIVEVAHNIYKGIAKDRSITKEMKSLTDVYINARDNEAKNRDHYLKLAEEETDPEAKKLWQFMALEEQKHFKALDEMVKFITSTDSFYYW
jgi:rubrerythrin